MPLIQKINFDIRTDENVRTEYKLEIHFSLKEERFYIVLPEPFVRLNFGETKIFADSFNGIQTKLRELNTKNEEWYNAQIECTILKKIKVDFYFAPYKDVSFNKSKLDVSYNIFYGVKYANGKIEYFKEEPTPLSKYVGRSGSIYPRKDEHIFDWTIELEMMLSGIISGINSVGQKLTDLIDNNGGIKNLPIIAINNLLAIDPPK